VAANYHDSLLRPVPWLDSFGIDGDVLDVEHKWLIEAFNHAGLEATHFANEERLFDQLDYADNALQRQEHDHIRSLSAPMFSSADDDHSFIQGLVQARTGLVEHLIRHDLGFKTHLMHRDGK